MTPIFSEEQIFEMKMRGDILEVEGYDVFDCCLGITFKDDVQCRCGAILKAGEEIGTWYFAVRYPNKRIIKWACGCLDVDDI